MYLITDYCPHERYKYQINVSEHSLSYDAKYNFNCKDVKIFSVSNHEESYKFQQSKNTKE